MNQTYPSKINSSNSCCLIIIPNKASHFVKWGNSGLLTTPFPLQWCWTVGKLKWQQKQRNNLCQKNTSQTCALGKFQKNLKPKGFDCMHTLQWLDEIIKKTILTVDPLQGVLRSRRTDSPGKGWSCAHQSGGGKCRQNPKKTFREGDWQSVHGTRTGRSYNPPIMKVHPKTQVAHFFRGALGVDFYSGTGQKNLQRWASVLASAKQASGCLLGGGVYSILLEGEKRKGRIPLLIDKREKLDGGKKFPKPASFRK